jgi:hypothetical protein
MPESSQVRSSPNKEKKGKIILPENNAAENFVEISLHDHVGELVTRSRRGLERVLKLLGKNRIQVVCGRASNADDLNKKIDDERRLIISPKSKKRAIEIVRKIYSRMMRKRNGNEFGLII